jgi:hypothetical protein
MVKSIEDKGKSVKKGFAEFSKNLDKATIQAARDAFDSVVKKDYENTISEDSKTKLRLPIRPVVIGGDDLTVIIKGNLAIDFTNKFLNSFKQRTAEYFKGLITDYDLHKFENGLTACAGIAYVKPSYPFHYAVELAEELCSYSKTKAKKINGENVPSCLTFHKVQSSFVDDYKNSIVERELKMGDVYLNFGPYSTDDNCKYLPKVSDLKEHVKQIKRADSPKSNLRNWLSELSVSSERAEQLLQRTKTIHSRFVNSLELDKSIKYFETIEENRVENGQEIIVKREVEKDYSSEKKQKQYTHIYDILTLASIEKN